MTTFLDTNILICLAKPAEPHHAWATMRFTECKSIGPAIISDIVYSEFSVAFTNRADVDFAVATLSLERMKASDDALFRAGKAFRDYRKNGGVRMRVLPDFIIGAIAETLGVPLLTTNEGDYKTYFPALRIIHP